MASCLDGPGALFKQEYCVIAVSKDVKGTVSVREQRTRVCEDGCTTLHTIEALKAAARTHAPCDAKRAAALGGSFAMNELATIYDIDRTSVSSTRASRPSTASS